MFIPNGQTIYESVEQTIISILNSHNVSYHYPAENEKITLSDNEYMQFFNLKEEYYNEYYNITKDSGLSDIDYTNYNNFSMVTLFRHLDNFLWFTGDIETGAEKNIYKNINQCDLLKIEHHGANLQTDKKYLEQLNPKYAVLCNRLSRLTNYQSPTIYNVKSKNAKFYSTYSNSIIHFISKYNSLIAEDSSEYDLPLTNLLNTPRSSNSRRC